MEILFEILFGLLHFFGEFVLQMVVEVLAELGLLGLREPFRRPKPLHPIFAAFCYVALGALLGGFSLVLFPSQFIHSHPGRVVNLMLTPLAAGLAMAAIGAWRLRRGKDTIRLDRFAYGYLFALAMGLVRFIYAAA
jgi:hypothetical protein